MAKCVAAVDQGTTSTRFMIFNQEGDVVAADQGLATGLWSKVDDLRANWAKDKEWRPQMPADVQDTLYRGWLRAVTRTFDWVEA